MKKALAILMVLALVASAATAEITFGAWGRGLFVPVSNSGASGAKSVAENKASWGGAPRIGMTVAGNSDNVGFQIDLNGDNGSINAGDQQFIWVKPMDMVKLSLGRVQEDALRGNAAFGSFNWNRAFGGGGDTGEDFTFTRMSTGSGGSAHYDNKQGLVAALTPVENLWVGVAVRDINNQNGGGSAQTATIMNKIQAAFGYTVADVGQIRAQIIRNPNTWKADGTVDKNNDTVEIAFKYTGMENLMVDAGFRMWTLSDVAATKKKQISIYGNYKMDALTAHLATRIDLNEKVATWDGKGDMGLYVGAGVDYALDGGIGVAADVRYYNETMKGSKDARTQVFAGVTKGFSNGLIGAGFEVDAATDTGYSIPVRFEYWF